MTTPSAQQQALIDFPRTGRGSVFGEAKAGSGKTTTALLAVAEMTGTVAVMAFNKPAAVEFTTKAKKLGLNFDNRVRFGTCHSFGLSGWRRVYPEVKYGPEATNQKRDMTIAKYRSIKSPEKLDAFALKLCSLAKQGALGLIGDIGDIDDRKRWHDIVEHHDLAYELEADDDFAGEHQGAVTVDKGIDLAIRTLRYHRELAPKIIDFDDMIYMPVVSGIRMWQNDWVVGDEWQDANIARRALARKMLKPAGRAMFIGDRHQAIYGFTGADNDSIANTIREFNCVELPLSVSYRCSKAVIVEAQRIVPDIQACDTAPEGSVSAVEYKEFMKPEFTQTLLASDAILCRKTRPLVATAYALIKAGVACHVEGREIGAGLIKLVNRFVKGTGKYSNMGGFRDRLLAYAEKETAKLVAKGKETQAEALSDRVDTILVIMDSIPPAATVEQLRAKIETLFSDSEHEKRPTLTLATCHKSKGREWDRVFILGYNQYMPSPFARQEWSLAQERNLQYVGITRAKRDLVFIDVED